jgi:hypothetical protein
MSIKINSILYQKIGEVFWFSVFFSSAMISHEIVICSTLNIFRPNFQYSHMQKWRATTCLLT